jgi:hypothetical protein
VTALVVAGLFSAGAAKADSTMLYFTLTGPVDATFELSSNPFVDPGNADPGFGFLMTPTDLTINGVASSDVLAFYNTAGGGGFAAFDSNWNPDFSLYGAVLYGGKEWKPKFGPSNGTIELADEDGVPYSLTITKVATPEPGSLLLLLAGLLPLGLLAKRR